METKDDIRIRKSHLDYLKALQELEGKVDEVRSKDITEFLNKPKSCVETLRNLEAKGFIENLSESRFASWTLTDLAKRILKAFEI